MNDRKWLSVPLSSRGLAILFLLACLGAAHAGLTPEFSKNFDPATIGPGSVSTLTFTIMNPDAEFPLDLLAFTDVLPASVTIAAPAKAQSFCGGTLSAPAGGGTITFSDGMLGASQSCTIRVDVTSATAGTHTNTSGALTSDAGTHDTASADLDVALDRPGFTKSFAPSSVALGGRSTLTFTIDNDNGQDGDASSLDFTDNLPLGMTVANPANATTDCVDMNFPNTTLTATPGSSVIDLDAFGLVVLPASAVCTASVDVIGGAVGMLGNTSGELFSQPGTLSSGKAAAVLTVTGGAVEPILLLKEFTNDPVPPGGNVTLVFTLTNTDRDFTATGINFDDDVDAAVTTITYTGLEFNTCDATPTGTGTGLISFSGGSLGPEASCSFGVTLAVPAGVAPGTYTNTTTPVMADVDGTGVTGSAASDLLFVAAFPIFTKEFIDDPAGAGGSVTLRFTFTNTTTLDFGDLEFTDDLNGAIPGLAANGLVSGGVPAPLVDPCGMGSELTVFDPPDPPMPFPPTPADPTMLIFTGGSLAAAGSAGDSCTFDVVLDIPTGIPAGIYVNTTSAPTATSGGILRKGLPTITGQPATDGLVIVGAPRLTKEFTDDPTAPGGMVTLEFTLEHDAAASGDATGIAFTDDLNAALMSLMASGTPPTTDCTGATVDISTPTLIDFSGGTLMPGEICTASVELTVPGGAMPGSFPNTTSDVTATVDGVPTIGNPGSDNLRVAGLMLTKEFTNDPAFPGDTVNLRFTLDNTSGMADASAISFSDDLDDALTGLVALAPLPMMPCGGTLSGTSVLMFSGGSVMAGTSCFFDVTVQVPAAAADGAYVNATSNPFAIIGMSGLVLDPATDVLIVDSELLAIGKSFTDDPAIPGGTVTLQFTIDNLDPARAASAIAFSDDLTMVLAGLMASGTPPTTDCAGATVDISTPTLIDFSGGSLMQGANCTASVELTVPAGPLAGDTFTNTTSMIDGTINGFAVSGPAASDDLRVTSLVLDKSFGGVGFPGQTVDLTFTITNLDSSAGASSLSFSDSMPAGLSAVPPLPPAPCGAGSTISGTTFLTFSGGSLGPSGMCSFDVTVLVPVAASPGSFPNTTSDLFSAGISVSGPGTDTLTIEPPPTFAKAFAPASRGVGQTSTLSFSIDNGASTVAATGLAFTDNLPAGVEVAAPPATSNGCGGTVTASAGATAISLSGGTVGAGMNCGISVNVAGTMPGVFLNTTGDLTSTSGNSGTASDTLTVNPQPGFAKSFAPNPIVAGAVSTLTFTIDNGTSTVAATGLDFTDNLPAGVVLNTPANAMTTCTGGTLTAPDGGGTISYSAGTVAAMATCTVSAEVTSAVPGTYVNISGTLTSSLGDSGQASDTLTVSAVPPGFAKAFAPNPIVAGAVSTVTFTIDNAGSLAAADNLDFTDNLPAGVFLATPAGAMTTCIGGTLSAPDGGGTIMYSGGTVGAMLSCTVSAQVTSPTPGMYLNTAGDLTSSLGNSGPASDTLIVNAGPVPAFSKAFAPAAIGLGGVSTLSFSIDNTGSLLPADNLDFTDMLPTGVFLATPAGAMTTCIGGTLSAPDGGGTISYTGTGSVAAGGSCTVDVNVTSNTPGMYVNTSGDLTSSLGNSGPASAMLDVAGNDLSLAKAFVTDPVLPGGTVGVEFTITNASAFAASGIGFSDDLNMAIPGMTALGLPISACGGILSGASGNTMLTFAGGSLGPNSSCVIAVTLQVPASTAPGSYTNTTGDITGILGGPAKGPGVPVTGAPASAMINVAFLNFSKVFVGNASVGGIAMLSFTISNPDPANSATAIGFSDDLDAFIAGAEAIGLPQSNVCGAGSTLSGTSLITLTGGTLGAGGSCTFQVQIQLPDSVAAGAYTNTTGSLQATVGGSAVTGAGAVVATAVLGVGSVAPVPSLSTWGLLLLTGLLLLVSARRLRGAR